MGDLIMVHNIKLTEDGWGGGGGGGGGATLYPHEQLVKTKSAPKKWKVKPQRYTH